MWVFFVCSYLFKTIKSIICELKTIQIRQKKHYWRELKERLKQEGLCLMHPIKISQIIWRTKYFVSQFKYIYYLVWIWYTNEFFVKLWDIWWVKKYISSILRHLILNVFYIKCYMICVLIWKIYSIKREQYEWKSIDERDKQKENWTGYKVQYQQFLSFVGKWPMLPPLIKWVPTCIQRDNMKLDLICA